MRKKQLAVGIQIEIFFKEGCLTTDTWIFINQLINKSYIKKILPLLYINTHIWILMLYMNISVHILKHLHVKNTCMHIQMFLCVSFQTYNSFLLVNMFIVHIVYLHHRIIPPFSSDLNQLIGQWTNCSWIKWSTSSRLIFLYRWMCIFYTYIYMFIYFHTKVRYIYPYTFVASVHL